MDRVFINPRAFRFEKNEQGKYLGFSVSGFCAPDGEYYKISIPYKSEDGKISSSMIPNGKFKNWIVVEIKPDAVLDMKTKDGLEATLDIGAFKQFIQNKNRKFEQSKFLKNQNKGMDITEM